MTHPTIYYANVTIAGNEYSVKYMYAPGCPACRGRDGGLRDPGDDPIVELIEVTPIDTSNADIGARELERRIEAELYKHHAK